MKLKNSQVVQVPHTKHYKGKGVYKGLSIKFEEFLDLMRCGAVIEIDLRHEFLILMHVEYIAWYLKEAMPIRNIHFPNTVYLGSMYETPAELAQKSVFLFSEIRKIIACNNTLNDIAPQGVRHIVLEYFSSAKQPLYKFMPHECITLGKEELELSGLFSGLDDGA